MIDQYEIDESALDQLLADTGGEAAFIVEIIDDYLADARSLLVVLADSIAAGDATAARDAAHSMKGTSASIGARALSKLSAGIEMLCREGDLGEANALRSQLGEAFAQAEEGLLQQQARFRAES